MGGFRQQTSGDASYTFLMALSYFSLLMFIPLLLCYLVLSARSIAAKREGDRYWPEGMDE
jgi:hypothetical protein